MRLDVGRLRLELIHVNIHSDDAAVVWMPEQGVLLAGDTMEDTVTYVAEPDGLDAPPGRPRAALRPRPDRILPNHGDPDDHRRAGATRKGLIRATQDYIRVLQRCRTSRQLRSAAAHRARRRLAAAGWITYFAPYEAVHRENLEAVTSTAAP